MAHNGEPGRPAAAREAGRPGQVSNGCQTPAESTPPTERRRSIFRPLLFLVIFLVALIFGFCFHSNANPGAEPPTLRGQPSQYINVYETNALVPIAVTVILGQGDFSPNYGKYTSPIGLPAQGFKGFHEVVKITTGPGNPGTVILTSSTRPLAGFAGEKLPAVGRGTGQSGTIFQFAVQVPLRQGDGFVFFDSVPIINQDNGSTFGHLPSVGAYDYLRPPTPCLEVGYDRRTGKLKNVASDLLGSSAAIPAGERTESFGCPFNPSSYTEVIDHIVPVLKNEQIDYMNPALNGNSDVDYAWRSNSIDGLAPIFKATDPNAVDSQNQAAFISGIAFGVAGAAAIAIVQELPEVSKRRRKSRRQDAESPS
jgi:hypothetical protein